MKRDMDLIRRILEYLESQPRAETVKPPEFPNVSTHEVRDHARLCRETGYISEYTETLVDDGPPRTLGGRPRPARLAGPRAARCDASEAPLRLNRVSSGPCREIRSRPGGFTSAPTPGRGRPSGRLRGSPSPESRIIRPVSDDLVPPWSRTPAPTPGRGRPLGRLRGSPPHHSRACA